MSAEIMTIEEWMKQNDLPEDLEDVLYEEDIHTMNQLQTASVNEIDAICDGLSRKFLGIHNVQQFKACIMRINTHYHSTYIIRDKLESYHNEYSQSLNWIENQMKYVDDEKNRLYQNTQQLFDSFILKLQQQKNLYLSQCGKRLNEYKNLLSQNYQDQQTNLDNIHMLQQRYEEISAFVPKTSTYNDLIQRELNSYDPSVCIKNINHNIVQQLHNEQAQLAKIFDTKIDHIFTCDHLMDDHKEMDSQRFTQFRPTATAYTRNNDEPKKTKHKPLKILPYRWQIKRVKQEEPESVEGVEGTPHDGDIKEGEDGDIWKWCNYKQSIKYEQEINVENKGLPDKFEIYVQSSAALLRRRTKFQGRVINVIPLKKVGFVEPSYSQQGKHGGIPFYFNDFAEYNFITDKNPLFPGDILEYELKYFHQPQPGYRAINLRVILRNDISKILFVLNASKHYYLDSPNTHFVKQPKSILLQWAQKNNIAAPTITYSHINAELKSNKSNHIVIWTAKVVFDGKTVEAQARKKKDAETKCFQKLLEHFMTEGMSINDE